MKLTILLDDSAVYKDGVAYAGLSLSGVPDNVHAIQWDGAAGWIEFKTESQFRRPPNENITELPTWANDAIVAWEAADYAAKNPVLPIVEETEILPEQQ